MTDDVDVVIVGGGPAGLAAAIELRCRGIARVVVLEREGQAGGVPRHTDHLGFGIRDFHRLLSGPTYAARYVRDARAAGVDLRTESSVTGWDGPRTLAVTAPTGRTSVRGRAVVLATGCRERPRPARLVPGTRPLGVFTTGALQQLVYVERQRVARRAVVVGAEHVSFSAVMTLAHGGATTAAIVTAEPRHQSYAALAWATAGWRRVPILTDTIVSRIVGRRRVERVEVTDVASGATHAVDCDAVVFTLVMDATRGPRVDATLRTSERGVFAAGNLVHAAEAGDVAALSGRHAAATVTAFLRDDVWPATEPVPIVCRPPLRWISPGAVAGAASPPRDRFVLRVGAWIDDASLEVTQAGRVLHRRRYPRLVPGRSIALEATWVRDVERNGSEVTVAVDGGRHRTAVR